MPIFFLDSVILFYFVLFCFYATKTTEAVLFFILPGIVIIWDPEHSTERHVYKTKIVNNNNTNTCFILFTISLRSITYYNLQVNCYFCFFNTEHLNLK